MRRLLHVAMTRARSGSCSPTRSAPTAAPLQPPSPFVEEARAALGAAWEERDEELFGPAETLHATFRLLRDELLTTVAQVGGRLGELRFDTDLDVSHAVVRYLELLKLAALLERPAPAGRRSTTRCPRSTPGCCRPRRAEQREIFETSALDEYLLDAERDERCAPARSRRATEPSLEPFLPRRGDGLLLSRLGHRDLPDVPAEVQVRARLPDPERADAQPALRDPRPPGARALPRRRRAGARSLPELLGLLDAGWRRGGFGDSDEERQLRAKATQALPRYHERFAGRGRPSRCGSRAPSSSGSGRTCCAAAWTASTGCPTAATS